MQALLRISCVTALCAFASPLLRSACIAAPAALASLAPDSIKSADFVRQAGTDAFAGLDVRAAHRQ